MHLTCGVDQAEFKTLLVLGRARELTKKLFTHGHGVNTGENTQDLLKTSTSSCLSRRCCTCSCCSSSPSVRSSWSLMPQQRRAKSSGFLKMEDSKSSKIPLFGSKVKGGSTLKISLFGQSHKI